MLPEGGTTVSVDRVVGSVCGPNSTMNAPQALDVLVRLTETPQLDLPLAADGVLRYVWESRFGPMLIEVRGGQVLVNGAVVEPAIGAPSGAGAPQSARTA